MHILSEYVSDSFILYNDVQCESNVCTFIEKEKKDKNLLYSYSGNRIRLKMWSSKSSSIRHQGWMLCWKSPARKQHFFPRQNNNNHFTNNQMTRYIELLYWGVMIQWGASLWFSRVIYKKWQVWYMYIFHRELMKITMKLVK